MKRFKSNKKWIILGILLLVITIGYAALGTTLNINGTTGISNATWDIHWNNVQVKGGSVSIGTGDQAATITQGNNQEVTYAVTLNTPGDFYEFTVDAVNGGSIDGMIDTITSTYKIGNGAVTTITSNNLPAYLDYSVTYSDGVTIAQNQELKSGETETYKVRIEFKKDIENNQLPGSAQSILFSFAVHYKQADSNAVPVVHPAFDEATPWADVIAGIQNGTITPNVGDTKTVDMGSLGTHTLRVANTTTPAECATTGFSQTACGLVLEFADIITTHRMNPSGEYKGVQYTYGWNADGWPASEMRTYVNSDIYNALPTALKNAIIDTTVVSGHGSNDSTNFTSTDKLYLLSLVEVYGSNYTCDTVKLTDTRQLDYYTGVPVTTSSYSGANKKNGNSNYWWWLRSAYSSSLNAFYRVNANGYWDNNGATSTGGVSPAFRLS